MKRRGFAKELNLKDLKVQIIVGIVLVLLILVTGFVFLSNQIGESCQVSDSELDAGLALIRIFKRDLSNWNTLNVECRNNLVTVTLNNITKSKPCRDCRGCDLVGYSEQGPYSNNIDELLKRYELAYCKTPINEGIDCSGPNGGGICQDGECILPPGAVPLVR